MLDICLVCAKLLKLYAKSIINLDNQSKKDSEFYNVNIRSEQRLLQSKQIKKNLKYPSFTTQIYFLI